MHFVLIVLFASSPFDILVGLALLTNVNTQEGFIAILNGQYFLRCDAVQQGCINHILLQDISDDIVMLVQMFDEPNCIRCQLMNCGIFGYIWCHCAGTHSHQIGSCVHLNEI